MPLSEKLERGKEEMERFLSCQLIMLYG